MNKSTHSPTPADAEEPSLIHYMFACKAVYDIGEGVIRQREVNTLITSPVTNLTRESLSQVHRSVIQRICAEHKVTPDAVKDVIILSCFPLGIMTQSEFVSSSKETAVQTPQ